MAKRIAKHVQITERIRALIRTRRYEVGHPLPTEQKLAERFDCSRGTARRALDTLVNDGLIRRKQGAGNFVARAGDASHEPLLGFILPNILNAELLRLSQQFSLEAGAMGYRIMLGVIDEQPLVERELIKDLHRLKVSGIIKFPTTIEAEPEIRAYMRSLGLRYVILNDFWCDTSRDHHVAYDEVMAVKEAVRHLLKLGHRRIGWLDDVTGPRKRALTACREELAQAAIPLKDDDILLFLPYLEPNLRPHFRNGADHPTALITPYDGMAVRAIRMLERLKHVVPRDVSIVNMNGHSFYAGEGLDITCAVPPNEKIVGKTLEILTGSYHEDTVCAYLFRAPLQIGATTAGPAQ